jgi:hypothetical protein
MHYKLFTFIQSHVFLWLIFGMFNEVAEVAYLKIFSRKN